MEKIYLTWRPTNNRKKRIFKKILLIYFFRGGEGERKRREMLMCGCLLSALYCGPGPQPRQVPWLEIKLEPFGLQASTQSTEPHQAGQEENFLKEWNVAHHSGFLSTFSTYVVFYLDVSWHNCYTFGTDNTQVGIFKKAKQIGFTCLLQTTNSCTLEVQMCFDVLSNFTHQTLEGKFANQKFSGLLIISNFMKCHSTRPVPMRFLHPSIEGALLREQLW